ncbi:MAG: hypothetical protein E7613_06545 [Ruminococcaceae bacterium]|nr:hypothetical protein [Oscillospiraceae bacterium]
MNERYIKLKEAYDSEKGKEYLELGETIKKLDKSTGKRLTFVIVSCFITMAVLGYVALHAFGALLFIGITAIASFFLYYSSKKNVLLKYLTFYRSRIPRILAMTDEIEVKAENIPDSDFVTTLSDKGKLEYRMCHRYGELYIGFAKFMVGGEPCLQGLLYFTKGDTDVSEEFDALLSGEFDEHRIVLRDGKAMLFIPWVNDYLNGRVEMTDDLTFPSVAKQYDYYLLGKSFMQEVNGEKSGLQKIFDEAE